VRDPPVQTPRLVGSLPKPDHKPDHKPDQFEVEEAEIDRRAALDAAGMDYPIPAADSILATCRRHRIALRLAPDGALIIGKAHGSGREPALWPGLIMAIEAHAPAIASLVAAGGRSRTEVKAAG